MPWNFHATQQAQLLNDGRLEVQFRAGGRLEMAWHLYQWGDSVEVVVPPEFAAMVHPARREDFEALTRLCFPFFPISRVFRGQVRTLR